jgi:hypothetical protein
MRLRTELLLVGGIARHLKGARRFRHDRLAHRAHGFPSVWSRDEDVSIGAASVMRSNPPRGEARKVREAKVSTLSESLGRDVFTGER